MRLFIVLFLSAIVSKPLFSQFNSDDHFLSCPPGQISNFSYVERMHICVSPPPRFKTTIVSGPGIYFTIQEPIEPVEVNVAPPPIPKLQLSSPIRQRDDGFWYYQAEKEKQLSEDLKALGAAVGRLNAAKARPARDPSGLPACPADATCSEWKPAP